MCLPFGLTAGLQGPAGEQRAGRRPAAEPAAAQHQHAAAAAAGGRQGAAAVHPGSAPAAGAQCRPGAGRQAEVRHQGPRTESWVIFICIFFFYWSCEGLILGIFLEAS